ncbi:MAG TPA: hypothetical protein VLW47_07890, partial [Thermodesulfobacteriota bacterium]|nr:hypothetical protein [Thermodesulfobacteriota bacterium]
GGRISKLWNAGLLGRGDRCWMKNECVDILGGPESKRLKVAAPNLFHPTASPLLRRALFFHIKTRSPRGEEKIARDRRGVCNG